MACRVTRLNNGTKLFICGDLDDVAQCRVCGEWATILCDYPVGNEKTCDSFICERCAKNINGDLHYCPEHAGKYGKVLRIYNESFENGLGI